MSESRPDQDKASFYTFNSQQVKDHFKTKCESKSEYFESTLSSMNLSGLDLIRMYLKGQLDSNEELGPITELVVEEVYNFCKFAYNCLLSHNLNHLQG